MSALSAAQFGQAKTYMPAPMTSSATPSMAAAPMAGPQMKTLDTEGQISASQARAGEADWRNSLPTSSTATPWGGTE